MSAASLRAPREHDSDSGAVRSLWERLCGILQDRQPAAMGLAGLDAQHFVDRLGYGPPDLFQWGGYRALARNLGEAVRSGCYRKA